VRRENLEESIRFLLREQVDYEFRTTVVAQLHDEQSVLEMGQWLADLSWGKKIKRWFVQPFADRDTVLFAGLSAPDESQLTEFVGILSRFSVHSALRG
jgi:pyruvate formate lyase activating enzyme